MAARFIKARTVSRAGSFQPGGWQIVYTGFILIMLSFFILLTSFASLDQSKITRFVSSFSNAVSVLSGGRSIEQGSTMLDTTINPLPRDDMAARLFETVRAINNQIGLEGTEIQMTERGVVMTLKDKLLFESGQGRFSAGAYDRLVKIATIIKQVAVPVEIEGHTDDRPINTRDYPSNWELSTTRAVSVLRYLVDEQGVEPGQLSAVGFAQYHPVAANDSDEHRAMNRRVDFVFKTYKMAAGDI